MNNQTSSASDSSSNFDSEDSDNATGFGMDENDSDGGDDSDEEPDDDEEDSDEANVDQLVQQVESDFLDLLDNIVSKVEQQQDLPIQSSSQGVKVLRVISSSRKNFKEEGTQTDSVSSSVALSKDPLPDHDSIREEIECLRQARESLVLQRKVFADKVKLKSKSSEDFEADQKKVYEFEEAIEAIDLVVEFKNEVLCGRECIWSNCLAPGTHEADLVTRLNKLSMLDLQRLLSKYFGKMTEFRYTSKKLEKQCEESENIIKSLEEKLGYYKKLNKLQGQQCEMRIRNLLDLQSKHPTDVVAEYVKFSERQFQESQKQQIDLGRSLKGLLENCKFPGANDRLVSGILKKLSDLDINHEHERKYDDGLKSKFGASSSHRNGSSKMPSSSKSHRSRFLPEFADSRRVMDEDKCRYSDKRRVGITDPMNGIHQEMLQRLGEHKSGASQFRRHHVSSPPPSSHTNLVKRTKNGMMIIQPSSTPDS